jgi:hypothetical protein
MKLSRVMAYSAVVVALGGSASTGYIVKSGMDADVDILYYFETISLGALPYFGLAALLWFGSVYLSREQTRTAERPGVWSTNPWTPTTRRANLGRMFRPSRASRPRGPWAHDRRSVHRQPRQLRPQESLPDD